MVKCPPKVVNKSITVQSIDFNAAKSVKSNQSWRYKGNKVVRAPSIEINGTSYTDPRDPDMARRKQESNFFVCLNTNLPVIDEDPSGAIGKMRAACAELTKEKSIATYLQFGPVDRHYSADLYNDVVHSIDCKVGVEIGPQEKKLHAHMWLTITHYSQIQINKQMLSHMFKKMFNDSPGAAAYHIKKLPWIHIKLLPQSDWTDVMRQYIHKGMTQHFST